MDRALSAEETAQETSNNNCEVSGRGVSSSIRGIRDPQAVKQTGGSGAPLIAMEPWGTNK